MYAIRSYYEIAMLVASAKAGVTQDTLNYIYKRVDEIPFDSETRCMKVIVDNNKNEQICYAKGALDVILSQCDYILTENGVTPLSSQHRAEIIKKTEQLAGKALRVLAFASKTDASLNSEYNNSFVFLGLMGMLDPPRLEAKRVITSYSIHYTKLYDLLF